MAHSSHRKLNVNKKAKASPSWAISDAFTFITPHLFDAFSSCADCRLNQSQSSLSSLHSFCLQSDEKWKKKNTDSSNWKTWSCLHTYGLISFLFHCIPLIKIFIYLIWRGQLILLYNKFHLRFPKCFFYDWFGIVSNFLPKILIIKCCIINLFAHILPCKMCSLLLEQQVKHVLKRGAGTSNAPLVMPRRVFIQQHPGMTIYKGLNMEQGVAW